MICLEAFFHFICEFFESNWGHKQRIGSGCGGESLFFQSQSGKEFGNVLCTFVIRGESGCWKRWWPRANLKQHKLRGLRVAGPCFQIRLSRDALKRVFWGSEQVVWLLLYFLR